MIQQAVKQWDAYKKDLEQYLATHNQSDYDEYVKLLKLVITKVLNKGDNGMNIASDRITIINDGDYQGTLIFMMPIDTYQPSVDEYYWTHNYYGSCSGCDALLRISEYEDGLPSEEQVKLYMNLCLHMVQRLKHLITWDEVRTDDENETDEYDDV